MGEPQAKVFDYSVELSRDGVFAIPGGAGIEPPEGWTADDLLLAALLRCSLDSFTYHARRAGHEVREASGSASGRVMRRESDGRFAFTSIDCRLAIALSPQPAEPADLVAKAERDCFVGASLAIKPDYVWQIG